MTCALVLVRWSKQDLSCDSSYLNVTANAAPDPSTDVWLGNSEHCVCAGARACMRVLVHTHMVACTCLPACGKLAVATWPLSGKDAMVILCLVQHLAPSVLLSPSFASHISLFSHFAILLVALSFWMFLIFAVLYQTILECLFKSSVYYFLCCWLTS